MVQYTTDGRFQPGSYWKLQDCTSVSPKVMRRQLKDVRLRRYDTPDAGFPVMMSRFERSMLLYEKCTMTELLKFCNQRGLRVEDRSKYGQVIDILHHADECAPFHRFLDLPPELRVAIYRDSFESFENPRFDFVAKPRGDLYKYKRRTWKHLSRRNWDALEMGPPPLARVCSLLRRESLPTFYEIVELTLTLDFAPESGSPFHGLSCLLNRWDDHTHFISRAPAHILRLVPKFDMEVTAGSRLRRLTHTWKSDLAPEDGKRLERTEKQCHKLLHSGSTCDEMRDSIERYVNKNARNWCNLADLRRVIDVRIWRR